MFQQPNTQVNPPVDQNTLPNSPGYANSLVKNFATQMQPQYQASERDLRSNLASRGMLDSGIGASAQAGLAQNRLGQIGDYASALGQQQAGMNEAERVRQQLRGFQKEDMATQWARQQNMTAEERQHQNDQQAAQNWMQILQGAGTIAMMI